MSAPAQPCSLVTGASAGIGAAFAHALAARGHDLILTARRADRLEALAAELRAAHGSRITVLPADLAIAGEVGRVVDAIAACGLRVDWLINNAGYGVPGTLVQSAWERHAAFLRVLIEAPTELAWALLPAMRARGYGRIVNVASLAGHVPAPAGNTLYAGSKAYWIRVSQALAAENEAAGIHVTALWPGFTRSEFHDVTGSRALMNELPSAFWQSAEAVVTEGIAAVEAGRPVHVTGRLNRTIARVFRLLPAGLAARVTASQGRRYRLTGED